ALGSSGDDAAALEAFERSIEIEPRAPQTWQAYATALGNLGRFDEAAAAWRRCVELAPGEVGVLWLRLGQAELRAGRTIPAHEALERAAETLTGRPELDAARAEAMLRLASVRLGQGEPTVALALVRRADAIGQLAPGLLLRAGGIAWQAGDEATGRV
ncbi:MAG TPA: tetratricopeptide repeat protein, partial [Candidatus Polarisedimenticolaceae bacterium]|nr:tetratricopeptide repeat protein [Candidatus Polarisedimenticolaceae bacterium]